MVQTSDDGSNHTTPESSPIALNQINRTREDMTREIGTGRGSIGRAGKSAARTNIPVRTANMPTIPTPIVAPQIAGGVGAPTSNHGSTSPTTLNQTNPITVGTSSQINQVGEDIFRSNTNGESNSSWSHVRTLVTITSAGLQPSKACSNRIHESFKSELDHNRVNWKGVLCDLKDGYFGEFKKHFYWDSSITDAAVNKYSQNPKCVEKSKINAQNHCGGKEVSAGTYMGGSISIGEYRKRLVTAEMGRDPTPSELHLHVHTHGHDGKSFVDERSRIVHVRLTLNERFEETL
ncbi:hypothetical protein P3L10_032556 [Capsicum annuum]